MSASENSNNSNARSGRTHTAPKDVPATLTALPAPMAEKTLAAAHAVRGVVGPGGWLWVSLRARKGLAGGSAASTVALVTGAYALGRRAGLRRRGPISRLTGGRL